MALVALKKCAISNRFCGDESFVKVIIVHWCWVDDSLFIGPMWMNLSFKIADHFCYVAKLT